MKIVLLWFKASGKYYTDGEGILMQEDWDHYFSGGDKTALHEAMVTSNGGKLPGLSTSCTELACTITCDDKFPHHFPAGTFA